MDLDNAAVVWAYQHPELETAVLRPTNVIGPDIKNAMSTFLRLRRVPTMMGFDPMSQFVFQDDLAEAIVLMAEDHSVGAFNVAGPRAIPWRKALEAIDAKTLPIPTTVALTYLRLAGLVTDAMPPYLVNFLKFSCVISDEKIRRALAWAPEVEPEQALKATVGR